MKKTKKISQKNKNSIISTDNEMLKLIILIIVVALVFAIFYVITLFVTKKDNDTAEVGTDESTEATIQYQKILAGNILSQSSSEYYVLVYFNDNNYVDLYKNYLTYYSTKVENALPYYFVDMDEVFNSSFISDNSNLNVSNAKDLKFSQTALLRIKNNTVVSSYEGNEQITGKLGRMTK